MTKKPDLFIGTAIRVCHRCHKHVKCHVGLNGTPICKECMEDAGVK